jgi:hypothetical protein
VVRRQELLSPWLKALAEVRIKATREGWYYQHVQAIIVSIDQYAEKALGNRDFFLNRPQSVGPQNIGGERNYGAWLYHEQDSPIAL